jgi:SAM-dependent methyltransferase
VSSPEWGLGRYEHVAAQLLPAARVVIDRAAPRGGERVVDVGCGTGNAALLAAERGARVVGVDPAARLLEVAAADAAARGVGAEFASGDAAALPLGDGEADLVISVFGAIFAPDPVAAAAEMARVAAPGGRIVMSAWIPRGAVSAAVRMSREAMAAARGAPPSAPAPFPWHERGELAGLFGPHGFDVATEEHRISFASRSAREFVEAEAANHPLAVASRAVLGDRAEALNERLVTMYEEANEDPGAFRVTSRYLVATASRDQQRA